jgi:hypothetical protein
MSCIYFVTTGISFREKASCWKWSDHELSKKGIDRAKLPEWDSASSLKELVQRNGAPYFVALQDKREAVHNNMGGNLEACKRNVDDVIDNNVDLDCWSHDRYRLLPAELATLFKMLEGENPIIKPEDKIVFLGGETNAPEAVLCWRILRRVAESKVARGEQFVPAARIQLYPKEFPWDPTNHDGFLQALDDVWKAITDEVCKCGSDNIGYVLSGGYKAVLLGIVVKHSRSQLSPAQIYYLHEKGDQLISLLTSDLELNNEHTQR